MNRRLPVFVISFTAMNLAFVPLLSLYGLRVCPVLAIPGFGFGCYYSAAFIVISSLVNLFFIFLLLSNSPRVLPALFYRRRARIWAYGVAYFLGTVIALICLQVMLKMNHLTTHSRAPEILTLASLLLGITQIYGLNWAMPSAATQEPIEVRGFSKLWILHIFRTMLPVIVVAAVLLHFLISQNQEFNEGHIAPLAAHDDFITQTAYLISFLLSWLAFTFLFHFLSERDHVRAVQRHLDHVTELDAKYRSNLNETWGLWEAIRGQLNSFSKILGERTRLLNTFLGLLRPVLQKRLLIRNSKKQRVSRAN
jgi:hypothetical protein